MERTRGNLQGGACLDHTPWTAGSAHSGRGPGLQLLRDLRGVGGCPLPWASLRRSPCRARLWQSTALAFPHVFNRGNGVREPWCPEGQDTPCTLSFGRCNLQGHDRRNVRLRREGESTAVFSICCSLVVWLGVWSRGSCSPACPELTPPASASQGGCRAQPEQASADGGIKKALISCLLSVPTDRAVLSGVNTDFPDSKGHCAWYSLGGGEDTGITTQITKTAVLKIMHIISPFHKTLYISTNFHVVKKNKKMHDNIKLQNSPWKSRSHFPNSGCKISLGD